MTRIHSNPIRSTTIKLCLAICAGLLVLTGFSATQAGAAEGKIAIVDFQRVLQESKRGKSARDEWEAEVKKREKAFDKIKDEIKSLQGEFEKQAMLLTDKMREQKQEELRRKLKDAERRATDYQDEIKRLDQKLTQDILAEAKKVVEDYAKDMGFDLVLEATGLAAVYSKPSLDITEEIIKLFDSTK